jgi:hypothetical protein
VNHNHNDSKELVRDLRSAAGIMAQGWCQFRSARDLGGNPVESNDPTAASWCALGSYWKASGTNASLSFRLRTYLGEDVSLPNLNDHEDTRPGDMEMFFLFIAEDLDSRADSRT